MSSPLRVPSPSLPRRLENPYILRIPKTESKALTIAAGFMCEDGIVLATDTEITQGNYLKRHGGKGGSVRFGYDCGLVLVGSGYLDLISFACEKVSNAVHEASVSKIRETVEEVIHDIYSRHIHPFYTDADTALQLIIGIAGKGEIKLYKSYKSVVSEAGPYVFIGAGDVLAYFLMENASYSPTIRDVASIASEKITVVKENVSGCGKGTHLYVLETSGAVSHLRSKAALDQFIGSSS